MYCSSTFFPRKSVLDFVLFQTGVLLSHIVWGGKKTRVFQCRHILGIGGFKFHNWGSRELARKNTRLLYYLNGFPELLGMGLIIAWGLSRDCAGAFLKFRWTVRKWCLEHVPRESRDWSTELPMHTLTVTSTNKSIGVHALLDQTMRPWTICTECEETWHSCPTWRRFLAYKE